MPCGVKSCSVNDDHLLWRCTYCDKKYHAACIGVQRHREHIITAFMVPMCADCQDILMKEADVRKLLHQQEKLLEAVRSQNDTNQRIAADLSKFSLVSVLFESIEHLLNEVNESLALSNKNNESIRNALDQHMVSCDSRVTSAITDINISNTKMSQKIKNFFDDSALAIEKAVNSAAEVAVNAITPTKPPTTPDPLPIIIDEVRNELASLAKSAAFAAIAEASTTTEHKHAEILFLSKEILEEVKSVSSAVETIESSTGKNSSQADKTLAEELAEDILSSVIHKSNTKTHKPSRAHQQIQHQQKPQPSPNKHANNVIKELFAERRAKMSRIRSVQTTESQPPNSGWRFINNGKKRLWLQDWSKYDAIYSNKIAERGSTQNKHERDSNLNKKSNNNQIKPSDKQLLATAKVQFAGPPPNTDHPIAALTVPKLINFRKGETINPYRVEKQTQPQNNTQLPTVPTTNTAPSSTLTESPGWSLDPLRPPIVTLTQQSAEGDGRFLKARLRDPNIMKIVRLFLAYMKDQPANICIDGNTPTSIRMVLASEGLPTDPDHLLRIFSDVHQEYGVGPAEAAADLEAYRRYLSSERTNRLQQLRENSHKFFSPYPGPSNFRK